MTSLSRLLNTSVSKKRYNPSADEIVILSQQSSKGLEFPRVVLVGLGKLNSEAENVADESRQPYVAMTRARECLLMTASGDNVYTRKIESITATGNGEVTF